MSRSVRSHKIYKIDKEKKPMDGKDQKQPEDLCVYREQSDNNVSDHSSSKTAGQLIFARTDQMGQ